MSVTATEIVRERVSSTSSSTTTDVEKTAAAVAAFRASLLQPPRPPVPQPDTNAATTVNTTRSRQRYGDNVRQRVTNTIATDDWDKCLGGLKNLRVTVFVVLFVTILLFLGQIFNWSTALLLLLIITQLVCISYEALQLTSETSDACYLALKVKRR